MAYRIRAHESVAKGIKRIARERLDRVIEELSLAAEGNPNEAVHEARKRLKELRAVLRLVRRQLGEDIYKRENASVRDAGRQLSDVRDAQVLIKTLDKLMEHFADSVSSDAFADIRKILEEHYSSVYQHTIKESNPIAQTINTLQTVRKHINSWSIKDGDWLIVSSGLKQVYKHGHKNFLVACDRPTDENLHEWRKRVKDLWYHLQILEPIWSDVMSELAHQNHYLSDYLGDDHDLAVLHQFISDRSERLENQTELEMLIALIECRRMQLQSDAKFLGQRIYAEKAKDFVRRLGLYWGIWRTETELSSSSKSVGK